MVRQISSTPKGVAVRVDVAGHRFERAVELRREESRCRLEDRLAPAQQGVLPFELLEVLTLFGRGAGAPAAVDLGLADPLAQRLGADAELIAMRVTVPKRSSSRSYQSRTMRMARCFSSGGYWRGFGRPVLLVFVSASTPVPPTAGVSIEVRAVQAISHAEPRPGTSAMGPCCCLVDGSVHPDWPPARSGGRCGGLRTLWGASANTPPDGLGRQNRPRRRPRPRERHADALRPGGLDRRNVPRCSSSATRTRFPRRLGALRTALDRRLRGLRRLDSARPPCAKGRQGRCRGPEKQGKHG